MGDVRAVTGLGNGKEKFFLFNQTVVSAARPRIAAACETINKIDPQRPTTTDDDRPMPTTTTMTTMRVGG